MPAKAGTADTGAVYDAQGNLTQIYAKAGDAAHPINLSYDALGRVSSMGYTVGTDRMTESYAYTVVRQNSIRGLPAPFGILGPTQIEALHTQI